MCENNDNRSSFMRNVISHQPRLNSSNPIVNQPHSTVDNANQTNSDDSNGNRKDGEQQIGEIMEEDGSGVRERKVTRKRFQACKQFYCGTLEISQKPIYTVYKHRTEANTLQRSLQGKNRKRYTSDKAEGLVRQHINRFPIMESHYCRSDTKRSMSANNRLTNSEYNKTG
ncbi:unnamed protein product [Acanthoscelides obtectus]|uniref:Uncharacterized protein n=1 Tax=Acanthoscelides obtectus TaxID=200917 RepID=A0A9P0NVV8_ACAOB|nr:unnamed protein product [Acanthoscelides obtectus]CAK1671273.1 hypothetical protein AOBTE_LOCUS28204 [Acanthoscelides obtectus]